MKRFLKVPITFTALAVVIVGLAACKKPADAVKNDLAEVGYQLTEEEWFRASRENDPAALKKFLSSGFKVDLKNPDGDTALHIAASSGAENSAAFLLERGLKIDQPGAAERTPLMVAVIADQTAMVNWLLRQGADPRAKDSSGFVPLMLAVREGRSGSVAELAPYMRDSLDDALLLAALVGRADVIDSLTNYGASPYARMEDGRTPLMIAAENGHQDAVKLLLDVGASRYAATAEGLTAADLATAAGYSEISAMILRAPTPDEMALETPADVAQAMDEFVDRAAAGTEEGLLAANEKIVLSDVPTQDFAPQNQTRRSASLPIEGEILSSPVPINPNNIPKRTSSASASSSPSAAESAQAQASDSESTFEPASEPTADSSSETVAGSPTISKGDAFPMPPIIMRHYRERDVPIQLKSVQGDTATLQIAGEPPLTYQVQAGDTIPGSNLMVVRVQKRMENSKFSQGREIEVSVIDVKDTQTGITREWISGVTSSAHDPVALVEDSATGKRYLATPGQHFKAADGTEFIVADVRPNQLIIEEAATGAVQTIPLRGPRG